MKARLIPILTLAAACTAFADLQQLDSAQFDYKYDMFQSPVAEDLDGDGYKDFAGGGSWLTVGTGVSTGTVSMVVTGSQLLKADAGNTTSDGCVWRKMNATAGAGGTGYTVEARLKVTESTGSIGGFLLNASTGDSSINSWLVFRTDSLYWGNGTDKKLMDIDATSWHTYRIVREPGSLLHSVYVDGVLVADDLPNGISASVNRIVLGAANANYKGKGQIAWLRFHKGAYAPVDEEAFIKQNRLQSDRFPVKYEMDASDSRLSPTAGTASDWKTTIDNRGGGVSMADGILSVTTGGYPAYWDTTDAAWKNLVDANTPYTVEFKIKVDSADEDDRAIQLLTGSAGTVGNLFVGADSVQWCLSTSGSGTFVTLDTSDNTDKFHTFRIAYDGATRHGFTVWRDGEVIGEYLVDCTNFYNYSNNALGIVRFGKSGGFNDGAFDVNYVRWKIGGVYPPDNRPGLLMILR